MDYSNITVLIITCYKEYYNKRRKLQYDTIQFLKTAGFSVYYLLGFNQEQSTTQYQIIDNFDNDCKALIVPILECYENLSIKSYLGFTYFLNTPCIGILKLDDDTIITSNVFTDFIKYMNVDKMIDYAGIRPVNFITQFDGHIRNKDLIHNYLSSTCSIIPIPVLYFAGFCYWISRKMINYIRKDNLDNISEDLSVGIICKNYKDLITLVIPPEITNYIICDQDAGSIKSTKYVIPILRGGVCNRIFQILVAIQYAALNNIICVINTNFIADAAHQSNIETFDIIQRVFPNIKIINDIFNNNDLIVYNEEFGGLKYESLPFISNKHIILSGYFQAYQHINILKIYNYLNIGGISNPQENPENTYFLHIRLGDYLKFKCHCVDLDAYYTRCINKLLEHTSIPIRMLVFSNEHTPLFYEKYNKLPKHDKIQYTLMNPKDSPDKVLSDMSHCQGGAICANSSLSLLGSILIYEKYKNDKFMLESQVTASSYLLKYLKSPIIFMPDKWMQYDDKYTPETTKDIYPPWTEIISTQ